jgi:hypothetical protein
MDEQRLAARLERALGVARSAWQHAQHGAPRNPMTQTAAIPAIGALAAALLGGIDDADDDRALLERATAALRIARGAWERTADDVASNPMARTAEKAVIGILAAGVLNAVDARAPR